jgi:CRP/FNR family transcriptional regulator
MTESNWLDLFPALSSATDPVIKRMRYDAQLVTLPAAQRVFSAGSLCTQYLLLTRGSVRVQLLSHGGRELVLYRVKAGDSCILTTSCLIADQRYPAEGITDDEVEAVALGRKLFDNAMDQSPQFRRFVFSNFARRLVQVIARMDEVTYGAVDARLSNLLLDGSPRLETTHQLLAAELGTAREVVSRHLKTYEENGWIRLHRGFIEVIDSAGLGALLQK